MRNTRNVPLNRLEWESFERKLNTIDIERERKAQVFLHEMDNFVTVKKRGGQTEIDIPWLDDETLLDLMPETKKQNVSKVATARYCPTPYPVKNNCELSGRYTDGYDVSMIPLNALVA